MIGYCDDTDFVIRDTDISLTKAELSMVLVLSDVLLIIVLIVGFNMISYMQKDYIYEFSKTTVGVRDFTLVISKLPESFKQYKDELSLKFALWSQIQQKIQECKDQELCPQDIDPSICEINFAETDIELIEKQRQMGELIAKIEEDHIKMIKMEESENRFKKNEEVAKAKTRAI